MSENWQHEKKNDPYYKKAKAEDYRSRASYKLIQLDKKFKIIKDGHNVVDLGASPGGWSQVALEKVGPDGKVIGVDLNRIKPFPDENFYGIKGDFTSEEIQLKIIDLLGGKANVVMSDASPSLCGIKDLDQLRAMDLINIVIEIADNILDSNGTLIMKVFQGPDHKKMLNNLKKKYKIVKTTKPPSSRKKSSEIYVIAMKYKGNKK